jgi:hypothetical protein
LPAWSDKSDNPPLEPSYVRACEQKTLSLLDFGEPSGSASDNSRKTVTPEVSVALIAPARDRVV